MSEFIIIMTSSLEIPFGQYNNRVAGIQRFLSNTNLNYHIRYTYVNEKKSLNYHNVAIATFFGLSWDI